MALILDILLSGWNDIYNTTEDMEKRPGVQRFSQFRKGLLSQLIELQLDEKLLSLKGLSNFLRIPLEDLTKLEGEGYISGDACNKIRDYIKMFLDIKEYQNSQNGPLEHNIPCDYRKIKEDR